MNKRVLVNKLTSKVLALQMHINQFLENTKQNPAASLERSERIFQRSAQLEVYSEILAFLTAPDNTNTLEDIQRHFADKAVTMAKSPQFSTSQTANLMNAFRLSIYTIIGNDPPNFWPY